MVMDEILYLNLVKEYNFNYKLLLYKSMLQVFVRDYVVKHSRSGRRE